jgi:hypothetical protein
LEAPEQAPVFPSPWDQFPYAIKNKKPVSKDGRFRHLLPVTFTAWATTKGSGSTHPCEVGLLIDIGGFPAHI